VWRKGCCCTRGLNQGRTTLLPSLAVLHPTVFKNHCLNTLHVLFLCGCGWASLPVCVNKIGSAAFKTFRSARTLFTVENSSIRTWQPVVYGSLPLSFLQTQKDAQLHVTCPWCKPLAEQSSLRHAHSAQTDI
jgi:hypothetical protein